MNKNIAEPIRADTDIFCVAKQRKKDSKIKRCEFYKKFRNLFWHMKEISMRLNIIKKTIGGNNGYF